MTTPEEEGLYEPWDCPIAKVCENCVCVCGESVSVRGNKPLRLKNCVRLD